MSAAAYDDLILGGLIGGNEDAYKRARGDIRPVHLLPDHRALYDICQRHYQLTGYPIDFAIFTDMLAASGLPPDRRLILEAEFGRHWYTDVPEAHFRYALHAVRDQRRDETLTATLSDSLRVMMGEGTGGTAGYEAARDRLTEGLMSIDRDYSAESPATDLAEAAVDIRERYEAAQVTEGLDARMVRTMLPEIDRRILGLRPGENMLVAGYSGHGKTTLLQNIAWSAVVQQRKSVLVLTNENQVSQYMDRIYNRHTHWQPGTVGQQGGINMTQWKSGTLSEEDHTTFQRVVHDLGNNTEYGTLRVVQMPAGASVEWAARQMDRFGEEHPIDLVILDYIGRCGPISHRSSRREELNDSVNYWKSALVGYMRGYGVPGITGYQISRDSMRSAVLTGYYDLSCLAETSEAERNADIVMSILKQDDIEGEVMLQMLKNRDGATMEPTSFFADFATTLITASTTGGW